MEQWLSVILTVALFSAVYSMVSEWLMSSSGRYE